MPLLRGAVTFSRYRVEPAGDAPPADPRRWLLKGLKARAFEPIDRRTEEERAMGFVELENPEATGFSAGSVYAGEYALFGFRVDTLRVSAAALKAELAKWAQAFEKENDRAPTRAETARSRTELRAMLRQRAVPSTKVHEVSWNQKTQQLQVWAASRKAVDEVAQAIEAALQVELVPLVPAAMAAQAGIAEDALSPTPELVGIEVSAQEVGHGEA
jgi:recombination associated protein RdgC